MKIEDLVRPNIKKLKPYTSARSQNLSGVLLDANENPYNLLEREDALNLNRYPDPNQTELRESLGQYLEIPEANLFAGVGSDEIIDLLIRIFCEPGKDSCIISEPTYGMYRVACNVNDISVIGTDLDKSFDIDLNCIRKYYDNAKMIFLCSPNNPTGNLLSRDRIETILNEFKGILIVDEAYIDFCESGSVINLVGTYDNLVVTRTFSKAWALAGARFGYAAASKSIIDFLFKVKAPYNLNELTSFEIKKALRYNSKKNELVEKILNEKKRIESALVSNSRVLKVYHSDANFILFKCENARSVYSELKERGIVVRDRSNQKNLEGCLRVSIGTVEENNKFLKALSEVL